MTPKAGTGGNLLVPVCFSASAVAYSSTRIENMFMSVGSAAGVAAKQLVDGTAATVQAVNVTAVQSILNSTFLQRIHGPPYGPPPPPGPPGPLYYNVSGAGASSWNGQYLRTATWYGGRPLYASTTNATYSLYTWQGVWRLAVQGSGLYYTAGDASGDEPPLTGWVVAEFGTAPPPTLIAPAAADADAAAELAPAAAAP